LKIWFDVLTPKQVMFFGPAVSLLREKGHEVLCTSREYREAVELARLKGFSMEIVGRHGGADKYEKLAASSERTLELARVVGRFAPDAAVTFSSPEGARVAFGLGVRHTGFNDSPHSEPVARLTVPLMSTLLCPWVIPYSAWTRYGIARKDISRYRALDPAAWLKRMPPDNAKSDRKTVIVRLEESKASYIADRGLASPPLVDAAVNEFSKLADVLVLCRYQDQIEEAKKRYAGKAEVAEQVFDGASLIRRASLFVGAGGTMSAEAALLGVPTISIAPVRFYIDDYLVRSGLVIRAWDSKALVHLGKRMLSDEKLRKKQRKKAAEILASMEDPTEKMISAILKR
jgi:predicted glycosyltransferase